uniref:Uncharacterized protein n=1 Tax=Anguilla anguilla TaxID=7936 RepID=A0A0E9UCD0_ANGAN
MSELVFLKSINLHDFHLWLCNLKIIRNIEDNIFQD